MPAEFKAQKILAPLALSLAPGGRLLAIQSCRHDPGLEVVDRLWPGENPFQVGRGALLSAVENELGDEAEAFDLTVPPPTRRRSSGTGCTRSRPRSATGSGHRRCSRPGTP
jgi:hypothetical protein